jgi:hypothetical protein
MNPIPNCVKHDLLLVRKRPRIYRCFNCGYELTLLKGGKRAS